MPGRPVMVAEQDDAVGHRNRDIAPPQVTRRYRGKANRTVDCPASDAVKRIHQPASAVRITTA
jgi:hypothetical protein